MKTRKIVAILAAAAMSVSLLAGCGSSGTGGSTAGSRACGTGSAECGIFGKYVKHTKYRHDAAGGYEQYGKHGLIQYNGRV